MATRESMIRSINRQIEQHLRTFGDGSSEYQDLMRDLEAEIGKAEINRTGRPFYSRSARKDYSMAALEAAAAKVRGKGTAFSKAQTYINDLIKQGIEPTDQAIREAAGIEKAVSDNFKAVYDFLKENEDDFENSDIRMQFAGNAGANASKQDLVDILGRVTSATARGSIRDVIDEAKKWKDSRNASIKKAQASTRRSPRMTQKEIEQKLKYPEEEKNRFSSPRTKVNDKKSRIIGGETKLNRGTKKDKGVKK